jgi:hypothetical protein
MSYKLTKWPEIIRLSDGAMIPPDIRNTDYAEYLQWCAAGNTPEPIDPPTAEELQAIQDEVDAVEARAYTKLQALKAMTASQVKSWVTANVKTLAQAQDAITTLAIGMSILARRI